MLSIKSTPVDIAGDTVGSSSGRQCGVSWRPPFLPQYPLDEQSAAPGDEGVDVVVVADPRQRVALVGKADAARGLPEAANDFETRL